MDSEPQTPNPIITIGALLLLLALVALVGVGIGIALKKVHFSEQRKSDLIARASCFRIAQQDIPDHSPAYWIERNGLENHSHRTRTSLRCTADLNGKLVEFDADQIWVARSGNAVSDTR